jgi:hypothetical protein
MYRLSKEVARQIINLNPGNAIDQDIADRQFEVIVKGFNYLNQTENNYLYIADEVGLGKTYIALGIASLLRYFSSDDSLQTYQDLIIVPKKNLQYKWQKEIKNFVTNNFNLKSNRVKSILGKPIAANGGTQLHNHLEFFDSSVPSYEIFRNSSFSLGFSGDGWKQKITDRLDEYGRSIMQKAFKHYRVKETYSSEENYPEIKRLFGYLMNVSMQQVDLVIIDEAHNYKHGVGNHVAYRNQVMSRIMGVVDDESDSDLFNLFPELKSKITPKANKVIFLSATPMDNGCHEIRNLLDVYIADHPYRGLSDHDADIKIKDELSEFMMRGLMKITLNDKSYSRNQYRHEHRLGNVNKNEVPKVQRIDDPFMSATIGLIQLKTAEVLNTKNHGGAFEMGMNASFETFSINQANENDVDEANHRNSSKGADEDVVSNIVQSYRATFNEELPHPKQRRLIAQLFEKMKKREKSLVFVRRIASVNEITRKLVHLYEEHIYERIKKIDCESVDIKVMLTEFKNRKSKTQFFDYLENIATRIWDKHKKELSRIEADDNGEAISMVHSKLDMIFQLKLEVPEVRELHELIRSKMHLSFISSEIRLKSLTVLNTFFDLTQDDTESEETAAGHRYFFLDYFTASYKKGLSFKSLISRQDWYRFNYYYLLRRLGFGVKADMLANDKSYNRIVERANNIIDDKNELLLEAIEKNGSLDHVHTSFQNRTFFTRLLEDVFLVEWLDWLDSNKRKDVSFDQLKEDVDSLIEILRGVFRNGSGLMPSYIAHHEKKNNDFEDNFIAILKSHFPEVIEEVRTIIIDFDKLMSTNFPDQEKIARSLYQQAPVLPSSGHHKRGVSGIALQFRMPGFPYVVITTDVLKEGEDLHTYCSDIYHYGIAWNPSDMEQRTGRIDRINSKTYYALKSKEAIEFENSLQVFYPYLSDTLEVNQMAKLFTKMNQFVQTFYDVTATVEKESKVSINEQIHQIPAQNKDQLESKFDHDNFFWTNDSNPVDLTLQAHNGQKSIMIKEIIDNALPRLSQLLHFQEYNYNPSRLSIRGVLKVQSQQGERKGPYQIQVIHDNHNLGTYDFLVSSKICNVNDMRSQKKRDEISNELSAVGQELLIESNFLNASIRIPLESSAQYITESLLQVVNTADNIELKYTGKDEE